MTPKDSKLEVCPMYSWTADDRRYAKLFQAISPGLRLQELGQSLEFLRYLDSLIVDFEAHIGHTDEGFDLFRKRHQYAMENLGEEIPSWPNLGNKNAWKDVEWEKRYRHLVFSRQTFAQQHCQRNLRMTGPECKDMFGLTPEKPARTVFSPKNTRPRRPLRNQWWQSLDTLLERASRRKSLKAQALVQCFWRTDGPKLAMTNRRQVMLPTPVQKPHGEHGAA